LEVLAGQARDLVPGVIMRESLALYRQPPGWPDWTASVGQVRAATAAELPPGYGYGLRFAVPLVEMPLYLPWLVEQVREGGGEIRMQRVNSLGELSDGWADALVNCSGLGARELAGDLSVYPVRGQIVRVTNPGLTLSVRDENHPAGRAYVHPRTSDCMSTWPALVRARSTDSASVTSSAMPIAGWPSSAATSTAARSARAVTTTRCPKLCSRAVTARPIPRFAPVTNAVHNLLPPYSCPS
jgi:glycine/D-amino acid oxidase-like deaminating enzyme